MQHLAPKTGTEETSGEEGECVDPELEAELGALTVEEKLPRAETLCERATTSFPACPPPPTISTNVLSVANYLPTRKH